MNNENTAAPASMQEQQQRPNDQAHRHGGEEAGAAERATKLQEAVEAAHDAVFGAAPCSPFSVSSSETESLEFGEFTWFDSADVEDDFRKILRSCRERASGRKLFVSVELSAISQEDETMFSLRSLREGYKKALGDGPWSESRKKNLNKDQ